MDTTRPNPPSVAPAAGRPADAHPTEPAPAWEPPRVDRLGSLAGLTRGTVTLFS